MDSATAGLLGAGIGAVAGVAGSIMSNTLQARTERQKWLRDRRVEAYTSAIRFLIRMSNKRSRINADGVTVLGQDAMKEWFDDISEARSWLTSLLVYCSERERANLTAATHAMNLAADEFITAGESSGRFIEAARAACLVVAESARNDVGSNIRA